MPRPNKLSSKAKSQRQAGQSSFGPVKFDTEDLSDSEYNDSNDEEEESTLQSISAILCVSSGSFTPDNDGRKWKHGQHGSVDITEKTFNFNSHHKLKRQKVSNRLVVYRGDSQTTAWWNKKSWKKAAGGYQPMESFFMVSDECE